MEPLTGSPPPNLAQLRDALSVAGVTDLQVCSWHQRKMLRGRILVRTGKHAGEVREVGWSFASDTQPYPEYAPHWFHVEGDYDDGKGGACEIDQDEAGHRWRAYSRPIGPSWVNPFRTAKKLLRSTVARFWKAVR